jgi:2-keto-4-pentenoate hydratase/2-oxohepta-3-ene-1,7-dioic acid hydratase in catechol pathway
MHFQVPSFPHLQFGSIYCIGRNFAKHAAEMNSDLTEDPVVFLKPRSSLIYDGGTIQIPLQSKNVHHEVELVVLIGKEANNVTVEIASDCIAAFGVGLDITARDIQSEAKKNGLPWTLAKGFNTFAPLGSLAVFNNEVDLQNLDIEVQVNGEIRQSGNTSDMLFPVNKIISYLSHQFTLYPGDLIFTGTPEGVSQIIKNDVITATLGKSISTLQVHVSE